MLVLTRRCQESVVVGASDDFHRTLKVTVLEIPPGCVRLGFEADRNVPVHRGEVWERIRADGPKSSAGSKTNENEQESGAGEGTTQGD